MAIIVNLEAPFYKERLSQLFLYHCAPLISFLDFRFYEDASDEFKEGEGTLLPLWKFEYEEVKGLEITSLCWNPHYNDLFAAGFGSCNKCTKFPLAQ